MRRHPYAEMSINLVYLHEGLSSEKEPSFTYRLSLLPLTMFQHPPLVLNQDGPFEESRLFRMGQHDRHLIPQRELHLSSSSADIFCATTGPVSQARDAPVHNTARYSHLLIHQEYREHKRVTLEALRRITKVLYL